ncbi:MAG: pyridoxal-dependent decarboxylase [Cyclobacteriaceae bacterium]
MNLEETKCNLDLTWEVVKKAEHEFAGKPILGSNNPEEIKAALDLGFPSTPQGFNHILSDFESQILPFLNRNTDVRFGAYITGSGSRISALAEFIKAFFNQNGLKWNNSPITSELEQLVIQWISEFVDLPAFKKGILTSGGSMSNLMAIHFALASKFPGREMKGLYAEKPFTIYCSNQTHSSVDRAMVFLGLGREFLRKIDVNEQYEIDVEKLREVIQSDVDRGLQPLMLIGNAGTTNTGSLDDLVSLAAVAKAFDLWYHVDGAYGLPARRLPELREKFNGIEHADSITINPHKWMYVTFEASCVLLKKIPAAINFSPDYLFTEDPGLRWESSEHTIELSKEFRALKIWFTMKYYGAAQLTDFVKHDIELIAYLADQLKKRTNFEVERHHPLSILCFRWIDNTKSEQELEKININAVRQVESNGEIFITGTKLGGKTYLRVYYGNPDRTEADVEHMISKIDKVFEQVLAITS